MIVRRILLINIVLLIVIFILSYELYSGWQDYEDSRPLERIIARASGQGELPDYPEANNARLQNNFYSISENDLFHPDRHPQAVDEDEAKGRADAPKFPKDPEMQGVIESEGEKKALLTIFDAKNSNTGESRIVGIDDTVQGWTVSEITDTTTTLTWNDLSEIIDIFGSGSDSNSMKKPPRGSNSGINIVTIGNRQSVVETTTMETVTAGESGIGSLKSSSSVRPSSSVGAGRFSTRPTASPGSRPNSQPD